MLLTVERVLWVIEQPWCWGERPIAVHSGWALSGLACGACHKRVCVLCATLQECAAYRCGLACSALSSLYPWPRLREKSTAMLMLPKTSHFIRRKKEKSCHPDRLKNAGHTTPTVVQATCKLQVQCAFAHTSTWTPHLLWKCLFLSSCSHSKIITIVVKSLKDYWSLDTALVKLFTKMLKLLVKQISLWNFLSKRHCPKASDVECWLCSVLCLRNRTLLLKHDSRWSKCE